MIGSNGIFINNNESFEALKQSNYDIKEENVKEENFEKLYRRMIHDFIHISEISNEKMTKYEPKNIQVIKRVGVKDNQKYEFNMITRDKIEILKNTDKYFEGLTNTNFYQEALNNLIDGKKQFDLIARIFREERNIEAVRKLLYIQLNCIGGINVEERKERIEEMIQEGEKLKKYFYINNENQNKLKAYIFKLQGALKANNVEEFMKLFTMFYGSLEKPMPNCKAIKVLLEEPEYFRLLGYSYIYGLEKIADKKEEE